jgi:type VI secretion system protein VasD
MIGRRTLFWWPALLLAACGSPPPPPAVLNLTIIAGADQNPDASGHPQSVAVRLFELGATAKFERADVFALTERGQQTLGEDDMGSQEFVLRPGETRAVNQELKKGVQFIGVAVSFRDIDRARWRAVNPVAASGPSRRVLKINGITATLAAS